MFSHRVCDEHYLQLCMKLQGESNINRCARGNEKYNGT
jgi:hypothetical protein